MVGWMRGLVNGLQNRLHPFESGTDLISRVNVSEFLIHLFFLVNNQSNSLKTTPELGISKKKHYLCIQVCKITYIIYYKHV